MLDHAFIARYLDSFADEGGMHIILEYASGGTLQQQCKLVQEGKVQEIDIWVYTYTTEKNTI